MSSLRNGVNLWPDFHTGRNASSHHRQWHICHEIIIVTSEKGINGSLIPRENIKSLIQI